MQFISDQILDTYIAEGLHVHPSKKYAPFLVRVAVAACLSYIIHFGKLILFFIEFELSKVSSQRSTSCCRKLWFVAVSVQKKTGPICQSSINPIGPLVGNKVVINIWFNWELFFFSVSPLSFVMKRKSRFTKLKLGNSNCNYSVIIVCFWKLIKDNQ